VILSRNAIGLRGLRGLGADCPSYAPYSTSNGGCSNVPESLSQAVFSEFDDYGYGYKDGIAVATPEPVGESGNYAAGAGGGYQNALTAAALEASLAEAEADARRAEQQGRALGLNVTCKTYQNTNPGGASLFGTDCTVNGQPGHDADLLNLPGGWNIAATSAQYAAGNPVQHLQLSTQSAPRYDYVNPNTPDTLTEIRRQETVAPPPNTVTVPSGQPAPVRMTPNQAASPAPAPPAVTGAATGTTPGATQNFLDIARGALSPVVDQAAASAGLSGSTVLLIGGAALLFFLMRGSR